MIFLSDFASLIRKNFEAAQQAFIPLEQEMENIVLYLRLEKMRFHDKFEFELVYGDELDPDDWMMPTMILQPLVENAILHGLMPSKIPGRLILQLTLQHDDMLIEVIDNGVGPSQGSKGLGAEWFDALAGSNWELTKNSQNGATLTLQIMTRWGIS